MSLGALPITGLPIGHDDDPVHELWCRACDEMVRWYWRRDAPTSVISTAVCLRCHGVAEAP